MKRLRIIFLIICVFVTTLSIPANAVPLIDYEEVGCNISDNQERTIEITLSEYAAKDLMDQGADSLIAKLTPNIGNVMVSEIVDLNKNSRYTFNFVRLKDQKYTCQLAAFSNGVRGTWSEPIEIRLGDIPDCSYGYEFEVGYSLDGNKVVDKVEKCRPISWEYVRYNDGFDKYIYIQMQPDESSNDTSAAARIYCDKGKIEVYVWAEYADTVGWSGSGQVKFDNGSPRKVNYWLQRNFDGISLKDPKTFMANLVKAKKSFGFKIFTVSGYTINRYPVGNLLEFRSVFAKSGCKF